MEYINCCNNMNQEPIPMISVDKMITRTDPIICELTSMVQLADLCSYVIRRFFELGESDLFDRIKKRFDKHNGKLVGIRHFTDDTCTCAVCAERRQAKRKSD